jgi:hypothetical protein
MWVTTQSPKVKAPLYVTERIALEAFLSQNLLRNLNITHRIIGTRESMVSDPVFIIIEIEDK